MNRSERLQLDGDFNPVLFYAPKSRLGLFSNFSEHPVKAVDPWTNKPRTYQTGEHRYQAMKANNVDDHEYVLEINDPGAAKNRGRQVELRAGWGNNFPDLCWYVMLEVVTLKARQNIDVLMELADTQNHVIYEDSPIDDIWGWRYQTSYNGKNLLGRCWMQARDNLEL